MKRYRPRAIAFTSKKAASVWSGKSTGKITLGRQEPVPDFPQVFVMCSPSGLATGYWSMEPWQELAKWLKSSRKAG
jgi:TDG/mug DNA glycosylase family protein